MPETTNHAPICLTLTAFVFILYMDDNRWVCQKGHMCTIYNKHVHTLSQKQVEEEGGLRHSLRRGREYIEEITNIFSSGFEEQCQSCGKSKIRSGLAHADFQPCIPDDLVGDEVISSDKP